MTHGFPPYFDEGSRILILGSFPSVKSREVNCFYGHPQNRFWKLLARLRGEAEPVTEEEKRAFLKRNHIALYDTIEECDIRGSSDSSITNVIPADLTPILEAAPIKRIFTNGKLSGRLFARYQEMRLGVGSVCLPSTSPANAAWSLDDLAEAWRVINETLDT